MCIYSEFWINLFDECVTSSVYENSVNFDEGVDQAFLTWCKNEKKVLYLSSVDYITCQIL